MKFKKGNPGRPKGANNKMTSELKELIKELAIKLTIDVIQEKDKLTINQKASILHKIYEFATSKESNNNFDRVEPITGIVIGDTIKSSVKPEEWIKTKEWVE